MSTTWKAPWLSSCSGDTILPPPRAGRPCLRLSNTKKILGYPATRIATHKGAKQMQLWRQLPELLSRRRCCRRELRVFFAEAKTQRRHLDFGSGREELSLRSQQSLVPHQQLTDQLLPGPRCCRADPRVHVTRHLAMTPLVWILASCSRSKCCLS